MESELARGGAISPSWPWSVRSHNRWVVPRYRRASRPIYGRVKTYYPTLIPTGETNEALYEIVFNRVVHPEDERLLGAFVVGVPMPDLLQKPPTRLGVVETNIAVPPFLSGLWVAAIFVDPDDMPRELAGTVSQKLQERLGTVPHKEDDFVLKHGPQWYWVFVRLLNPDSVFPASYQVRLYSLDQARADWSTLRWQVLGTGAGGLLLALVLSWIIAHSFSAPIQALVSSTGQVRQGNFDIRVPVRRQDELGHLAASFNEMAAGLAQKERYRTILTWLPTRRSPNASLTEVSRSGGGTRCHRVVLRHPPIHRVHAAYVAGRGDRGAQRAHDSPDTGGKGPRRRP